MIFLVFNCHSRFSSYLAQNLLNVAHKPKYFRLNRAIVEFARKACFVFIVGRWIAKGLTKFAENLMNKRQVDPTIVSFAGNINLYRFIGVCGSGSSRTAWYPNNFIYCGDWCGRHQYSVPPSVTCICMSIRNERHKQACISFNYKIVRKTTSNKEVIS